MQTFMVSKAAAPLVPPAAKWKRANKGLLTCMYPHVGMEITLGAKGLRAVCDLAEKPSRLAGLFSGSFLHAWGLLAFEARPERRLHAGCERMWDDGIGGGRGATEVDTGKHHEIVLQTGQRGNY